MKNLVIGASGLVGSAFVRTLRRRGEEVVTFSRHVTHNPDYVLDLSNTRNVSRVFQMERPDRVFLCAYAAGVDWCESNPQQSWNTNVLGTLSIAIAAEGVGAEVVFPSSSYVFDGNSTRPYRSIDPKNPINLYGRDKSFLENYIYNLGHYSLVFRTVGVYGVEPTALNFQGKNFVDQMVRFFNQDSVSVIYLPEDQFMNPIYSDHLAETVLDYMETSDDGSIVHVAGTDIVSKAEWAVRIARIIGVDESRVIPVPTSELKSIAKRPRNACLNITSTYETIGKYPKFLEESLREYLDLP